MADYYVNEAMFALPERTFVDRTVHALESALPGGGVLSVTVLRRPIDKGKRLRELVDDHLASNEKRLSGFAVLDRTDSEIAGAPAVLLRTRWRHEGSIFYQLQAHAVVDGTWLFFSTTAPFAEQAACDETFEVLLQSLSWRTA